MESEAFGRQLGIFDPFEHNLSMTIIGAGGLGSPFMLLASKMGFRYINIYDEDVIETHNLSNQFHRRSDLGKSKVDGLVDSARDFSPIPDHVEFSGFNQFVNAKTEILTEIVVLAVDSNEQRAIIA